MSEHKEKSLVNGIEIVDSTGVTLEEYKTIRLTALQNDPAAFAESYQDSLARPNEKWQERLDKAREKKTSWMLFAREQRSGKLVGMVGGYRSDENITINMAEIWGVFVDSAKRGQGIAAALMEGILEEFSHDLTIKTAKLEVNIDQFGAKNLYTRFGFKQISEPYPHSMGDGVNHQIIAMEKTLI